ncbi:hypothetical protein HBI09_018590 [Parastagonospora nodorum]|nr:hypothetical protein HBI09_018590 [Parastagonospora nodorum]KAH5022301.1 hypothetical protein HBI77_028350 [Parastagonospora nodorum]
MLQIEDNDSLHVALKTLKVRGVKTMRFWLLDISEDSDNKMDDGSKSSSIASWKSEGYYTEDGNKRLLRRAQRAAIEAEDT